MPWSAFGDEHPRLVALSHPLLQPADSVEEILQHSQQSVDLIDLEKNAFRTFPVREVLTAQYPLLRYVAQVHADGYLSSLSSSMVDVNRLVVTFDGLLRRTPFARLMKVSFPRLKKPMTPRWIPSLPPR